MYNLLHLLASFTVIKLKPSFYMQIRGKSVIDCWNISPIMCLYVFIIVLIFVFFLL